MKGPTSEGLGMRFVDGVLMLGRTPTVALPEFLAERLSDQERLSVLPRLNPLSTGSFLDPTSTAAAKDPELAALVQKLMAELRLRFEVARWVTGEPSLQELPPDYVERFGTGAAAAEKAEAQMAELGFWALTLHPGLLECVRGFACENLSWAVDALALAFEIRRPESLDGLRSAWSGEKQSRRAPSHDSLVAHTYRRELAIQWARAILQHHERDESIYVAQAVEAAKKIIKALRYLAQSHLPPSVPAPDVPALDYLNELAQSIPVDSSVPIGRELVRALVELRAKGGQMRRFLGFVKPRTILIKKAVAEKFGIKVEAVHKALTRSGAKKNVLAGL